MRFKGINFGGVVFLLILIVFFTLKVEGEVSGDRELLRLCAEANKNNREKIHTWTGKATISYGVEKESGYRLSMNSSASFVLSQDLKAVRWQYNVLNKTERLEKEAAMVSKPTFVLGDMLYQDKYYDFAPTFEDNNGVRHNALAILPKEKYMPNVGIEKFHPIEYMNPPSDDLYDLVMRFYAQWDDIKNYSREKANLEVHRVGNIVKIENRNLSDLLGVIKGYFEIDLSKGGNLIVYRSAVEGRFESDYEWTYTRFGDVWVPDAFQHDYREPGSDGLPTRTLQHHIKFVENALNEAVDPNEFTIEKLGVVKGTRITDRVAGVYYKYGDSPDAESSRFK